MIVTNLNKIHKAPSNITEIYPGRAISYTINWPENTQTNLLTIYAPNTPLENTSFWNLISTNIKENLTTKPDMILGNFNMVEDTKDCLPPHPDPTSTVDTLQALKLETDITDRWRKANPHPECDFTFEQPAGSSRLKIDRIYANEGLTNRALNWKIENPDVPTDHQLVSVKIYNLNTPHIGCRRWVIPLFLLKDNNFFNKLEEAGLEIQTNTHHVDTNPQKNLNSFIESTRTIANCLEKIKAGKMNSTIRKLINSRTKILQKVNINNEADVAHTNETTNLITLRIQEIEKMRFKKNQMTAKANWHLKGELINKYWCAVGRKMIRYRAHLLSPVLRVR